MALNMPPPSTSRSLVFFAPTAPVSPTKFPNGSIDTMASENQSPSSGVDFGYPLIICFAIFGVLAACSFYAAKETFRRRQRLLAAQQSELPPPQDEANNNVEMVVLSEPERRAVIENKLVSIIILNEDQSPDAVSCSVCLNEFKEGEKVSGSSNPDCRHLFHTDCIVNVFLSSRPTTDCPVCRRNFIPNGAE